MSKSYSRAERRRMIRRSREERELCGVPAEATRIEYAPAAKEPDVITGEWALEQLSEDITFAVHNLKEEGYIGDSQVEDYLNLFSQAIIEAVPKYDPTRTNAEGRTSSARHFLRRVLRSKVCTAIESISVANAVAKKEYIDDMKPQDPDDEDFTDEPWVSDRGRSVRDIDWRLDMESMMRRMTKSSRIVFAMILAGYDHNEAMAAAGVNSTNYWRVRIREIQDVLVEGSYGPVNGIVKSF